MDINNYKALSSPPDDALKKIEGGNLKGKSDINPQWRIEALTAQFGLCGVGWKFEILDKTIYPIDGGEILLYMTIALYIKDGEKWSDPIIGCGGDFIRVRNKNGLVANDEAFKMCLTDALGSAMRNIGVAADVYRGFYDTKYKRQNEQPYQKQQSENNSTSSPKNSPKVQKAPDKVTEKQLENLRVAAKKKGVDIAAIVSELHLQKLEDITIADWAKTMNALVKKTS